MTKIGSIKKAIIPFALVFSVACSSLKNTEKQTIEIKSGQQQSGHFEKMVQTNYALNYLIYFPENYITASSDSFPLVLFLHGAGERGSNLDLVKKNGPPMLVEKGKQFPFILVSPQCPENQWWDSQSILYLLDNLLETYKINPDRVYLTGLSMGGFGTWDLIGKHPEKFAAAIPVCGGGEPIMMWNIGKLPVWAFHGAKDNVVDVKRSEDMVNAIKRMNGDVQFTVYPEAGHDSWTEAYNTSELYTWMMNQNRSKRNLTKK